VYNGSVLVSAVNENGQYTAETLNVGDIWYFPKGWSIHPLTKGSPVANRFHSTGSAHTIQGLAEENEYLLVFDDGDFDKVG
jgi:oxalate decarboxylase